MSIFERQTPAKDDSSARGKVTRYRISAPLSCMVEPHSDEVQDPGPQGWCVCGHKVTIADPREVTLPNGRAGWEGALP